MNNTKHILPGVNHKTLARTWAIVRKEVFRYTYRDVIDYLDYDLAPDRWISNLLTSIHNGQYRPSRPIFAKLAKSNGFERLICYPSIPDLVLYRLITDQIRANSRKLEHTHAYYERSELSAAQQAALEETTPVDHNGKSYTKQLDEWLTDYKSASTRRFRAWLKYNQYRKYLIFHKIHEFIVVTDISNFFDSVIHTHIIDVLHQFSPSPASTRLLELLFQTFSSTLPLRSSDPIGLPVDEADCSRAIAHTLLFPHDTRMTKIVGSNAFVRWMDDQILGVDTRASAVRVVNNIQRSLSQLHLAANTSKTKILSISEAKVHFQLASNDLLDLIERMPHDTNKQQSAMRIELDIAWKRAIKHEDMGNWDKVLKRFYRLRGIAASRRLVSRALSDCLRHPNLTPRILDYVRTVATDTTELLDFIDKLLNHPEQQYADIAQHCVESMLRLEPNKADSKVIWNIGSSLLNGRHICSKYEHCVALAPLLLLRYADKRCLPSLRRVFNSEWDRYPPFLIRSCALVYASYGSARFAEVRKAASKNTRNPVAATYLVLEKIKSMDDIPNHFRNRFVLRYDSLNDVKFADTRTILTARLLCLSRNKAVRQWVKSRCLRWKTRLPAYDQKIIDNLILDML